MAQPEHHSESFPALLSSREHLGRFLELEERTPIWRKLFGLAAIAPDMPRLRVPRVALPFLAYGRLRGEGTLLTFFPEPNVPADFRAVNLLTGGRWSWPLVQGAMIRRYQVPELEALAPRAHLSWFAVEGTEAAPFLFAAAAEYLTGDQEAPRRLLAFVERWAAEAAQGAAAATIKARSGS